MKNPDFSKNQFGKANRKLFERKALYKIHS